MNEDCRNAFRILMCREICDGASAGICNGALLTCSIYIDMLVFYIPFNIILEKFSHSKTNKG